ncbi:MAG: hypothetical protein ACRD2R_08910 [Terriglobales bacterium]
MSRSHTFLLTLCFLAISAIAAPSARAGEPGAGGYRAADRGQRALWVWRSTFLGDQSEQREMLRFARKKRIRTLFLFASTRRLRKEPELFRRFLVEAHKQGMAVQALNGVPSWVYRHQREGAAGFLDEVLRFNQEGPPSARFDAIHLDVEPQALPDWSPEKDPGERQRLAERYVDLLRWSRHRTRESGIPLAVDVPVSFNEMQVDSKPMLVAVLERVDELAVMAYLEKVPAILGSTQKALAHGQEMGKRV